MLKQAAGFVLAAVGGFTYLPVRVVSSLAAASLTAFLSILLAMLGTGPKVMNCLETLGDFGK